MFIQYPDNPTPELPLVWGIPPNALHRENPLSVLILQKVLAHHPQHYDSLVAVLAREKVWGKRIELVLGEIFLDTTSHYNPFDFFPLLMPDALAGRIEELSKDEEWRVEWDEVVG